MSRERARRRAERLAAGEARRAAAERRERRRRALRRLRPRRPDRRRSGRLAPRRTRAERAGIVLGMAVVLGLVWYLVDGLPAKIALTALVLIATPAFVVLTFDRRS